jgi:polyisoprenoid-binding protein YceI
MRNFVLAAVAVVAMGAMASAQTATWQIDPMHSSANFSVRHMGVSNVQGHMGIASGTVMWNDADVTKSSVQATIDMTTVDTGVAPRDTHLKSDAFFDVVKFPTMTFKSTSVMKSGDGLMVHGDLTMHGVTKPIVLNVTEISQPQTMKMGANSKTIRGLSATTTVNRTDFGVGGTIGASMVGEDIKVTLEIEMDKQ